MYFFNLDNLGFSVLTWIFRNNQAKINMSNYIRDSLGQIRRQGYANLRKRLRNENPVDLL